MSGSLRALATTFAALSLVSIGGPTATLPEIHRQVVSVLGWMDDQTFAHLFAISQIAPGPNILVVSLIGWHVAGFAGLMVATLASLAPSSLLAFGAGRVIARWDESAWVRIAKAGLVPVALGLILASGVVAARANDRTVMTWAITGAVAVGFLFTKRNPLWLLAAGALANIAAHALIAA